MDHVTSLGESEPLVTHPLFGGENTPGGRLLNIVIFVVCVLVLITTISAFVPHPTSPNVFFAVCVLMVCASQLILICWYRQGVLDPKLKLLIYFNTLSIVLLCICANVFFHKK